MSRFILPGRNLVRNISTDMVTKTKGVVSYKESLLNMPETKVSVIKDNGLKIASLDNGKLLASVGVFVKAGSRYDSTDMKGIANFFERIAFRGTKNRTAVQLEKDIYKIGGNLSAHTNRDHSYFYVNCLKEDVPKAVEILSDIIQYCNCDESEVNKERGRILKDLEEAGGNLTNVVFDYLHQAAFKDDSLGHSVLGTTEGINNINGLELESYRNIHFKPGRMVLAATGGVDHDQLVDLASKHFDSLPDNMSKPMPDRGRALFTSAELTVRNDDLPLAHIVMTLPSVPRNHPDFLPLTIAGNLIGSWDRSHGAGTHHASQLAQICHDCKYAHAFQQFHIPYEDISLWGNYLVCEKMQIFDAQFHLAEEWMRIMIEASDFEVERAKNMVRTNHFLSLDGTCDSCETIGKEVLFNDKYMSPSEFEASLNEIDASKVKKACMAHLYDNDFAAAALGPTEAVMDIQAFRARLYKFSV